MRRATLVLLLAVPELPAQMAGSGSLAGRIVSNDAGRPLPYSIVAVPAVGRERFTDDSGSFLLTGLPSGPLTLRVRRLGYAPMELTFPVRAPGVADPAKDSALATSIPSP